ncbi:MAG: ABC transporter ATP-binding protein [Nitrospinae bacterium]|nr:ABC transporter ATP-binding protein [Nitrospinota bacterium]
MKSGAAMQAIGLGFSYGDGPDILQGLDFHLPHGGFTAVLGANGSGKTTLLKLLSGLVSPKSGEIMLRGQPMGSISHEKRYTSVGLVFQNPDDQLFALTVEEDVAFGPRNMGLDESMARKKTVEALCLVGAAHLADRPVYELSFGQKKRVAIAGALAMGPSILLLDEPTAGLDPAGELNLMRLLGELHRDRGVTIVMATHSVDLLPLFADRIMILEEGRLMKDAPIKNALADGGLLEQAGLRLPYVTHLMRELETKDGLEMGSLPLTVGEARLRILDILAGNASSIKAVADR